MHHQTRILLIHCRHSYTEVFFFFSQQKMKSSMAEAETLQPVYIKMADSIK